MGGIVVVTVFSQSMCWSTLHGSIFQFVRALFLRSILYHLCILLDIFVLLSSVYHVRVFANDIRAEANSSERLDICRSDEV